MEVDNQNPLAPMGMPRQLDAYQLNSYPTRYSFGMDKAKIAKMLRDLADRIESGEYIPQNVAILSRAGSEEYTQTYLTMEFHQTKVKE